MEIVKLTQDKYQSWDKFCLQSHDAWFWHTSNWLEYTLNYKPNRDSQNHSFFLMENNKPLAICPLFIEKEKDGEKAFSFGGDFIPAACLSNEITHKRRKKILNFIHRQIDQLAQEKDIKYIKTRIFPLSVNSFKTTYFNYLLEYGYLSSDYNTQIIDLNYDFKVLENKLHENHKRNIKKYSNQFSFGQYTKHVTAQQFNGYKQMHHLAAGRITRPDITFELMYQAIKEGNSILFYIQHKQKIIGYYLISTYKNNAYYSSGAVDPQFNNQGVGHVAHWQIIKYLKEHNFKYYEIGWQEYSSTLFEEINEKRKNISLFKAGFGGWTKTCYQGIKFYDSSYINKTFLI